MRVFVGGDKGFGDTYIVDLVLAGLEEMLLPDDKEVVVITGHRKGAERIVRNSGESRADKVRLWLFGKNERFRRSKMIGKGSPHLAIFFQFSAWTDRDQSVDRMVTRCIKAGIPTYVILSPSKE